MLNLDSETLIKSQDGIFTMVWKQVKKKFQGWFVCLFLPSYVQVQVLVHQRARGEEALIYLMIVGYTMVYSILVSFGARNAKEVIASKMNRLLFKIALSRHVFQAFVFSLSLHIYLIYKSKSGVCVMVVADKLTAYPKSLSQGTVFY